MKLDTNLWLSAVSFLGLLIQSSAAGDTKKSGVYSSFIPVGTNVPSVAITDKKNPKYKDSYLIVSFCPTADTKGAGCIRAVNVKEDTCYLVPDSNKLGAKGAGGSIEDISGRHRCYFTDTNDCTRNQQHPALPQFPGNWKWESDHKVYRSFRCVVYRGG